MFSADTYSHYKEVPKETMFDRSIAEKLKLKKKGSMELKDKYRA